MEDMEEYQEELQEEKFSAGVWKKILHKVFKRKKKIIIMIISMLKMIHIYNLYVTHLRLQGMLVLVKIVIQ